MYICIHGLCCKWELACWHQLGAVKGSLERNWLLYYIIPLFSKHVPLLLVPYICVVMGSTSDLFIFNLYAYIWKFKFYQNEIPYQFLLFSFPVNTFIMKALIRGREIFGTPISTTPPGYRDLVVSFVYWLMNWLMNWLILLMCGWNVVNV